VPEHSPEHPWPGHLPAPAPSVLIDPPRPVQVLDATGRTVTVDERGVVPSPPATFVLGRESLPVTSWAGPWPVDERWWTPDATVKVARFQLVDVQGRAYLVTYATASQRWALTATYD